MMPAAGLPQNVIASISQANKRAIQDAFYEVRENWADECWLAQASPYKSDVVSRLSSENDLDKPSVVKNHRHLSQYIAASTILHAFDGWSYLGRAIIAELSGDPFTAKHLGYYAELRAGMAILATQGVGVFKRRHVVVERGRNCVVTPNYNRAPTHQFVWDVLRNWSSWASSGDHVLDAVSVKGLTVSEWFQSFPFSRAAIAEEWLTQWGVDIEKFAEDREARNLVSYRPTLSNPPGGWSASGSLSSISEFWQMCEPQSHGTLWTLDVHLLRRALSNAFYAAKGRSPRQNSVEWKSAIDSMLENTPGSAGTKTILRGFLVHDTEPDEPEIFRLARGNAKHSSALHSIEVIARAMLFLRVSTGCVANLMKSTGGSGGNDLDFWLNKELTHKACWESRSNPDSFEDLWADVEDALRQVRLSQASGNRPGVASLWSTLPSESHLFSTTERLAFWGMGF